MYRFGKHPPKVDYRTLRFRAYATAALAAPPPSANALERVFKNLHTANVSDLFPMDGNDLLGDCTIAGVAHAVTTYEGRIGGEKIMSKRGVVKLYMHLTGGVDSGLAMLDVLNHWHQHQVSGDKILAFVSIDPKNHRHVQQAIAMFGGVYLGFQVQRDCLDDFQAGKTWTPGPLTTDGHAVYAVGYDQHNVSVLTWGSSHTGTWDWWDECVDEAYAILSPETKKPGFAPGFDFAQLEADLDAVAN